VEADPRWHGGDIVVGHGKHVQVSQVEGYRNWDFPDFVVANVKHFKLFVFWPAELTDLDESISVKVEHPEAGQEFADGGDRSELVTIQAEEAEVFHLNLSLLNVFTSSTVFFEEL